MRRRVHLLLLRTFRRLPLPARVWAVHRLAPTFTVGAMCVIERADGRILLVRHSYKRDWGFPGGLVQRGEDVADCARREVMEEVGLAVVLTRAPTVVVDPRPRRVDVIFAARPEVDRDADTARPRSAELVDAGWFPPGTLPELQPEAASALDALARTRVAQGDAHAARAAGPDASEGVRDGGSP